MELNELNPFIRYYDKVKLSLSYSNFLKAYDFRLFFVVEGAFLIKFENKTISLSEKDMITIPPGTAYKIELENNKNSTHFILNFDFDHYKAIHKFIFKDLYV